MPKQRSEFVFRSRVPFILGEKMAETGRLPTNTELAELTGLSRATIITWRNPDTRFGAVEAGTLLKWMEYLQLPMDQILEIVPNDELDGEA